MTNRKLIKHPELTLKLHKTGILVERISGLPPVILSQAEKVNPWEKLSPREKQIVELLAEGFSNEEIAHKLGSSPKTIETQRHNIYSKVSHFETKPMNFVVMLRHFYKLIPRKEYRLSD